MPYTDSGRNVMLDALGAVVTHAGLLQAGSGQSFTGETADDLVDDTSHGLSNGQIVVLSSLTGGSGLTAGVPYYVVSATTNSFGLARTAGGSAVDFGSDVTAGTYTVLTEISGGSPAYARQAVTWASAAGGAMDETASPEFDVPAAAVVDYVGYYTASTSGTLHAIDQVTQESFGAQGTYTLTDTDFDLLAA
jgi:hypothetical protein